MMHVSAREALTPVEPTANICGSTGKYKEWPHQSGFFSQGGNWSTPYGKFFLQWYVIVPRSNCLSLSYLWLVRPAGTARC
jgi:hypothetical protein